MTASLQDEWTSYAADALSPDVATNDDRRRAHRAFLAGAQAALTLQRRRVAAADLQQELVFLARQIGTAHEVKA